MQLYFQKYGNGKPLVLLHGLFGSSDNWVSFARKLSELLPYEVYTVDIRNHGRSPHHHSFSMEALVEDLNDFFKQNNIKSPVLMGHSLGGKVILNYLNEPFSEEVKAAIIVDMGLRNYDIKHSHIELLAAMKNAPLEEFSSRNMAEDYFTKAIPSLKMQQFVLKNLKRNQDNRFEWKLNLDAIDTYVDGLVKGVSFSKKQNLPALFLKGELSDYINSEDEVLIVNSFNNAQVVTIPNAGHWVHVDNFDALLDEIIKFLKEIPFKI